MASNLKIMEKEKYTVWEVKYGKNTEKGGKWEMHTVETGKWWENWKNVKNETKYTVWPGIWREILKNMENEKWALEDLEYGEKTENHGNQKHTL